MKRSPDCGRRSPPWARSGKIEHAYETPRRCANTPGPADRIGVDVGKRICSVEGCERTEDDQRILRGMCEMHYARTRRLGHPGEGAPRHIRDDDEARFLAKIVRAPSGCWLWVAHLNADGYGTFRSENGTMVLAHRWAYEHWVGPIPIGMTLDHLCRVRRCVNYQRDLEPVPWIVNYRRGLPFWPSRKGLKPGRLKA